MAIHENPHSSEGKYFWFIIAVIGLLGVWLVIGYKVPLILGEFRLAFGHALLIAAILAATVDRFVKDRLIWEVTSNVWQYLAGHRVPTELSDYLHDSLQARLVRRNLVVTYTISKKTDGRLRADIEIIYDIENYGNKNETFPLWISEEKHKNPSFQEISCMSSDTNAWVDSSRASPKISAPDAGVVRAEAEVGSITVQPYREGLFYRVKFKYFLESIADSDSDVIAFNGPTIFVTIIATVPHGTRFIAPKPDVSKGPASIYRRVFLKEQHLHVRWFPAPEKEEAHPTAVQGKQ